MSNNNMTRAFQNIFAPLVNENINLHQKNAIHIEGNDQKLFEKLKLISNGNIVHGSNYAYLTDGDDHYLTLSNIIFEEDRGFEFDKNLIEYVEDSKKSFFVYLASKNILKIKTDQKEAFLSNMLEKEKEKKDFQYYPNTDVRRHEYENIYTYFDNFSIFKIPNESIFSSGNDIYKTILYLTTIHLALLSLPYSEKTIQKFQDVALSSANEIPYKYVCEAFIALQFKYAYKDLYRCIENLYGLEIIKKLLDTVNFECDIDKLREGLENILGWHPNELNSLKEIMKTIDEDLLNQISEILPDSISEISWLKDEKSKVIEQQKIKKLNLQNTSPAKSIQNRICNNTIDTGNKENIQECEENIKKIEKDVLVKKANFCATKLYKLRNTLVHYRKGLESKKSKYNDEKMEDIIVFMLKLIDDLYRKNG